MPQCNPWKPPPISLTIFNVVADNIIQHWVKVMEPMEVGVEVLGALVQDLVAYFYIYDGLVTSPQPESLQRLFDVLTDLFNRIGLCTKLRKTMSIAFQTCHTPAELLEAAYEQWVTGIGKSYQERLRS